MVAEWNKKILRQIFFFLFECHLFKMLFHVQNTPKDVMVTIKDVHPVQIYIEKQWKSTLLEYKNTFSKSTNQGQIVHLWKRYYHILILRPFSMCFC